MIRHYILILYVLALVSVSWIPESFGQKIDLSNSFPFDGTVTNSGCERIGGNATMEFRDLNESQPIQICEYGSKQFRILNYNLCTLNEGRGTDPETGKRFSFSVPCDVPNSCKANYDWKPNSRVGFYNYNLVIAQEKEKYEVAFVAPNCTYEFYDPTDNKLIIQLYELESRYDDLPYFGILIPKKLMFENYEMTVNGKKADFTIVTDERLSYILDRPMEMRFLLDYLENTSKRDLFSYLKYDYEKPSNHVVIEITGEKNPQKILDFKNLQNKGPHYTKNFSEPIISLPIIIIILIIAGMVIFYMYRGRKISNLVQN